MPLLGEFCKVFPACEPLRKSAQQNLDYWKAHPGDADPCNVSNWREQGSFRSHLSSSSTDQLVSSLRIGSTGSLRQGSVSRSNRSSSSSRTSVCHGPPVGGISFKQVYGKSFKQVFGGQSFRQVSEHGDEGGDKEGDEIDAMQSMPEGEELFCDVEAPQPSDQKVLVTVRLARQKLDAMFATDAM